ncbi:hypothetical protein MBO_07033 [Moraxella bovoculi 237]|uniref:DUF937 domain-containing protein n=1 Tax=Moraxella bovoculi 237 TaxID=743974 RepID=A0A066UFS5_9GAMM|nr:YidB family protein [Moraxella bovoculi]KDN24702.1 hypothetical protein MBO_07033 [Moraxella bovoculi 237]
MSLLQSIVTQVVQNAVQGDQRSQQQGGLGGLLGGLADSQNSNAGLGGVLGSQGSSQAGLGGLLRDVLGGGAQSRQASPTDLGDILGGVLGSQSQAQSRQGGFNKSTLLLALLPVVLAYIQKNGGLSGVLAKFQGNGLGNKAQSWTSIDVDNDGIDADDVARLFGSQEINEVAQKTGASELEVRQGIAGLLPQIMNDLTPHGSVEADESEANAEIDQILSQLRGKF